jgi:PfaD family protein
LDGNSRVLLDPSHLVIAAGRPREALRIIRLENGAIACMFAQDADDMPAAGDPAAELIGVLPGIYPEWLGDRAFCEVHGTRFPYVVGEMAQGIATARMVVAAANNGLMAFFGSAGLRPDAIEEALREISGALAPSTTSWGANLIHSPHDRPAEDAVVDVLLRLGVRRMSASAFMKLAPAIVRYSASGLTRDASGRIQRLNHVFAKVSRAEVAAQFLSPPPGRLLGDLVDSGGLTAAEAELASRLPVAEDVTAEADSGGHTDNRPLVALLPELLGLRDEMVSRHRYQRPIRIGAAGGLGTPNAVAAAFALGAAYVLTGSINQAAVESGLSAAGRELLCNAGLVDVAMAPAADMFELGGKVQVLKRGTMFAPRAQKLRELYRAYDALEDIPADELAKLEQQVFRLAVGEVWERTRDHFRRADPAQLERAERDPRHRMALVFRWYLFMGSRWAREGAVDRLTDFQIWCGPAMGAFNAWCAGSFLEAAANRGVVQIARNLLEGATAITRAQQLRSCGLPVPAAAFRFQPRVLA